MTPHRVSAFKRSIDEVNFCCWVWIYLAFPVAGKVRLILDLSQDSVVQRLRPGAGSFDIELILPDALRLVHLHVWRRVCVCGVWCSSACYGSEGAVFVKMTKGSRNSAFAKYVSLTCQERTAEGRSAVARSTGGDKHPLVRSYRIFRLYRNADTSKRVPPTGWRGTGRSHPSLYVRDKYSCV